MERIDNYLEFFKPSSREPRFLAIQDNRENIIFCQQQCEFAGYKRVTYDIEKVNDIIEKQKNPEGLMSKIVGMIHALQEGIECNFTNNLGKYQFAKTDYPKIYGKLANGLTVQSLENIKNHKMDWGLQAFPENLGEKVVEKLVRDKGKYLSELVKDKSYSFERN